MAQRITSNHGRILQLGGGRVTGDAVRRFALPPVAAGYANAQIDDYGGQPGGALFHHKPGLTLQLRARFSHAGGELRGTAGFGFWNAPYGDPSTRRVALPRAVWFFFASPPNDLPFAPYPAGRGWFAATLDATTPAALAMIPLAPAVLLLNQFEPVRRRLWPVLRHGLGIESAPIGVDMRQWHRYSLEWRPGFCRFAVDGRWVLETPYSPRGPLGFVCWIDNQYLRLTPSGRFRAGALPLAAEQWMEIADLGLLPEAD